MTDRTNANRQAALRERRRLAGLIQLTVWIHPTNKEKLRKAAKALEAPAGADATPENKDKFAESFKAVRGTVDPDLKL